MSDIPSVIKAYCTCKAGSSGYCNHVLATMYQTSHYCKLSCKSVPVRGTRTEYAQVWDKPTRGRKVKAQSVMKHSVKKAKLGEGWKSGQKCSLFEARKDVCNNNSIIQEVQADMKLENPNYGFVHMASVDKPDTKYVLSRLGNLVPQGSVLSYQLAITESNFETSSVDSSLFCKFACSASCDIPNIYPAFPLNQADHSPIDHPALNHVQVTREQAIELEMETRQQSQWQKWYRERAKRLTASNFSEIMSRKTTYHEKFLSR